MNELIPTRATLLLRLKDWQDQSSWQEFFDIYWRLMYTFAIKHGLSEVEAQDVVQETMISVARHMPRFKYDPTIGSFKTWLLNMTRWRVRDHLRKHHHPRARRLTATVTRALNRMTAPASENFDDIWEAEWQRNLLEAALANVKRRYDPQKFQIFDLYVNKEWEPERISKTFGIPVEQVYLAKHRVTHRIKAEVRRLEAEVT